MVILQLQSIDKVVDVPGSADRAGSSGASVVVTLVLPQLQIIETTIVIPESVACPLACRQAAAHRRVDELMGDFSGPCAQAHGQGVMACKDKLVRRVFLPHPSPPPHTHPPPPPPPPTPLSLSTLPFLPPHLLLLPSSLLPTTPPPLPLWLKSS